MAVYDEKAVLDMYGCLHIVMAHRHPCLIVWNSVLYIYAYLMKVTELHWTKPSTSGLWITGLKACIEENLLHKVSCHELLCDKPTPDLLFFA